MLQATGGVLTAQEVKIIKRQTVHGSSKLVDAFFFVGCDLNVCGTRPIAKYSRNLREH